MLIRPGDSFDGVIFVGRMRETKKSREGEKKNKWVMGEGGSVEQSRGIANKW